MEYLLSDLEKFIQFNVAAFLCFYTLRDSLRIPFWKATLYAFLFITVFCLLRGWMLVLYPSLIYTVLNQFSTAVSFTAGSLFLIRAAPHEKGKLVFVVLIVGSYMVLEQNTGDIISVSLGFDIIGVFGDERYIIVTAVGLVATAYPFMRFMDWLWARICDLRDVSWFRLNLVPLIFLLLSAMYGYFMARNLIGGWQVPAVSATMLACAFVTYWQIVDGLSKAADAARYAERLRSMGNQLLLQAELLKEASAHEGAIRQIRHDMRHHFAALTGILKDSGNERALSYLHEYIDQVEDAVTPPICRNAVADAVCRRFIALAERSGVQADVAAEIPEQTDIADSDLAVLLSNLWENAIEACNRQSEGHRHIKLRAKFTGGSLMISMVNSFDGVTRSRKGKGGEPAMLSLKRGGREEGIGIPSIQTIVKRYNGLCEFSHDADSFTARVMLNTGDSGSV